MWNSSLKNLNYLNAYERVGNSSLILEINGIGVNPQTWSKNIHLLIFYAPTSTSLHMALYLNKPNPNYTSFTYQNLMNGSQEEFTKILVLSNIVIIYWWGVECKENK